MSTVNQEGGDALADYALGRPRPTSDEWKTYADHDPEWSGASRGGSANLDMIGNACYLIWGTQQESKEMEDSWKAFFEDNKLRFQRTEQGSIIYTGWHVLPVLAVYRWAKTNNAAELEESARQWLLNFWGIAKLTATRLSGGRTYLTLCGERSSGIPEDNYYGQHMIWSEALGENWSGRSSALSPTGDINDFVGACIVGFSREIQETAGPVIEADFNNLNTVVPQYTPRTPMYAYRGSNVVACWWGWEDDPAKDAAANGNTGPVMVVVVKSGKVFAGPPEMGPHYRQKPCSANAWYNKETNTIGYRWEGTTGDKFAGEIALDSAADVFMKLADGKWTNLLAQVPVEPPAPVTPPVQPPVVTPRPPKRGGGNNNAFLIGGLLALLAGIFSSKKKKTTPTPK